MFSRQRISEVPIMLGGFKLFSTALWVPSLVAALPRVVNHHWIARSGAVRRRGGIKMTHQRGLIHLGCYGYFQGIFG